MSAAAQAHAGLQAGACLDRQPFPRLVRLFGSAVVGQAVLSAGSFAVGLLLIRYTTDAQFGYFVLALSAVMLATSLRNAFFGVPMVIRMTPLDARGRGDVVGGIHREQRRVLQPLLAAVGAGIVVLWALDVIAASIALLLAAGTAATAAALDRELFRAALLAHRRAHEVLKGDLLFVTLLVLGAAAATLSPEPAATALGTMTLAALAAGALLARQLKRHEHFNPLGAPGILAQIIPTAAWTSAGAAIHWVFSQGYSFVVAATLDVTAVAAIAGTRLLLMPVNLLSTGVSSLMFPVASGWLRDRGPRTTLQRVLGIVAVLAALAGAYIATMWVLRDWIFVTVLKKEFAERDALLALWSVIVLVMLVRDQLLHMLLARERFRELTALTLASALVSLVVTWWGMLQLGVIGALFGVLTGELVGAGGILLMSLHEVTEAAAAGTSGPAAAVPTTVPTGDGLPGEAGPALGPGG